jgi:hypothetical protein
MNVYQMNILHITIVYKNSPILIHSSFIIKKFNYIFLKMLSRLFIFLLYSKIAISQIYHLGDAESEISQYSKALKVSDIAKNTTIEYPIETTAYVNQTTEFPTNLTSLYQNVPIIEFFDKNSNNRLNYSLNYKPCNNCLTFDYFNEDIEKKEAYDCEFEFSEITLEANRTNQFNIESKNIQVDDSNIQLVKGKIIISQMFNFELTNRIDFDNLDDYERKGEEKFGVHINQHFLSTGKHRNYLLTYNEHLIYIFELDFSFRLKASIVAMYDKAAVLAAIEEPKFELEKNIIDFYINNNQEEFIVRLFVKGEIGIIDILSDNNSIIKKVTAFSSLPYGEQAIDLNIADLVIYSKEEEDKSFSAFAYLNIKDKGLAVVKDEKILYFLTHPYIKNIDITITQKPYFYIGLFVSHFGIKEFFVEIVIDASKPEELKLNKAFTYGGSFRSFVTDKVSRITYFFTSTDIIMIHRDIPYTVKMLSYKIKNINLGFSNLAAFTGLNNQTYIALQGSDYVDLLMPKALAEHPSLKCNFNNTGELLVKVSAVDGVYKTPLGVSALEFNTAIYVKSFLWIYIVVGVGVVGLIVFIIVCCYRTYKARKRLTATRVSLLK